MIEHGTKSHKGSFPPWLLHCEILECVEICGEGVIFPVEFSPDKCLALALNELRKTRAAGASQVGGELASVPCRRL